MTAQQDASGQSSAEVAEKEQSKVRVGQKSARADDKKKAKNWARGFGFALAGVPYVLRRPRLLLLSLIPLCINLLIGVGLFLLGLHYFDQLVAHTFAWQKPESWWLATLWWTVFYMIKLVMLLSLALLDFLAIIVIGSIVGAPFHELISCAVEKEQGRSSCDAAFSFAQALREIGAALRDQLVLLAIFLSGLLLIALFNLIPLVGNFAASILSLLWTWWFFALEFSDPALSRWGHNWRQKWRILRSHLLQSLSFGLGAWLLLFVPLTLPFLVAGGTLMACAVDDEDAQKRAAKEPESEVGGQMIKS